MSKSNASNNVTTSWDSLPDEIKNAMMMRVFRELHLVKGHSRLLILVTHGFIELLVNTLIGIYLKNRKKIMDDARSYPHSAKLLILNELGVLDDDIYKTLDGFRKLRNTAAHEAIFQITEKNMLALDPEIKYGPNKIYELCVDIIIAIWNRHSSHFAPFFAPLSK